MEMAVVLLMGCLVTVTIAMEGSVIEHFCDLKTDGIYAHPHSCNQFIKCNGGRPYEQECGGNLHFNPTISVCDHPQNSLCLVPGYGDTWMGPMTAYPSRRQAGELQAGAADKHRLMADYFTRAGFQARGAGSYVRGPSDAHMSPNYRQAAWGLRAEDDALDWTAPNDAHHPDYDNIIPSGGTERVFNPAIHDYFTELFRKLPKVSEDLRDVPEEGEMFARTSAKGLQDSGVYDTEELTTREDAENTPPTTVGQSDEVTSSYTPSGPEFGEEVTTAIPVAEEYRATIKTIPASELEVLLSGPGHSKEIEYTDEVKRLFESLIAAGLPTKPSLSPPSQEQAPTPSVPVDYDYEYVAAPHFEALVAPDDQREASPAPNSGDTENQPHAIASVEESSDDVIDGIPPDIIRRVRNKMVESLGYDPAYPPVKDSAEVKYEQRDKSQQLQESRYDGSPDEDSGGTLLPRADALVAKRPGSDLSDVLLGEFPVDDEPRGRGVAPEPEKAYYLPPQPLVSRLPAHASPATPASHAPASSMTSGTDDTAVKQQWWVLDHESRSAPRPASAVHETIYGITNDGGLKAMVAEEDSAAHPPYPNPYHQPLPYYPKLPPPPAQNSEGNVQTIEILQKNESDISSPDSQVKHMTGIKMEKYQKAEARQAAEVKPESRHDRPAEGEAGREEIVAEQAVSESDDSNLPEEPMPFPFVHGHGELENMQPPGDIPRGNIEQPKPYNPLELITQFRSKMFPFGGDKEVDVPHEFIEKLKANVIAQSGGSAANPAAGEATGATYGQVTQPALNVRPTRQARNTYPREVEAPYHGRIPHSQAYQVNGAYTGSHEPKKYNPSGYLPAAGNIGPSSGTAMHRQVPISTPYAAPEWNVPVQPPVPPDASEFPKAPTQEEMAKFGFGNINLSDGFDGKVDGFDEKSEDDSRYVRPEDAREYRPEIDRRYFGSPYAQRRKFSEPNGYIRKIPYKPRYQDERASHEDRDGDYDEEDYHSSSDYHEDKSDPYDRFPHRDKYNRLPSSRHAERYTPKSAGGLRGHPKPYDFRRDYTTVAPIIHYDYEATVSPVDYHAERSRHFPPRGPLPRDRDRSYDEYDSEHRTGQKREPYKGDIGNYGQSREYSHHRRDRYDRPYPPSRKSPQEDYEEYESYDEYEDKDKDGYGRAERYPPTRDRYDAHGYSRQAGQTEREYTSDEEYDEPRGEYTQGKPDYEDEHDEDEYSQNAQDKDDYDDYYDEKDANDDNRDERRQTNYQHEEPRRRSDDRRGGEEPEGEHKQKGGKPPKFENFPFNLLPRHLMGPIVGGMVGGEAQGWGGMGPPQFDPGQSQTEAPATTVKPDEQTAKGLEFLVTETKRIKPDTETKRDARWVHGDNASLLEIANQQPSTVNLSDTSVHLNTLMQASEDIPPDRSKSTPTDKTSATAKQQDFRLLDKDAHFERSPVSNKSLEENMFTSGATKTKRHVRYPGVEFQPVEMETDMARATGDPQTLDDESYPYERDSPPRTFHSWQQAYNSFQKPGYGESRPGDIPPPPLPAPPLPRQGYHPFDAGKRVPPPPLLPHSSSIEPPYVDVHPPDFGGLPTAPVESLSRIVDTKIGLPEDPIEHVHGPAKEHYFPGLDSDFKLPARSNFFQHETEHSPPFDSHEDEEEDMGHYAVNMMRKATDHVVRRLHDDAAFARKMRYVVDSIPFRSVAAFFGPKPYAMYISHSGAIMREFMRLMLGKYDMRAPDLVQQLDRIPNLRLLQLLEHPGVPDKPMPIPPVLDCCPYPQDYLCETDAVYRTYDGSCNNLKMALMGRSMAPFKRLLPAAYADDIDAMRVSVVGRHSLPGARKVSLSLFPDQNHPSGLHTHMMMIWGQFSDHDLTRTAIAEMSIDSKGFGETGEVKCGYDGCDSGPNAPEACWPIPIPHNDPDFGFSQCLKFVRSQGTPPIKCNFGPREQINQVTTWIDGSMIYGSTKDEAYAIRDFSDPGRGRLLVTAHPGGLRYKPLLPKDDISLCRGTNVTIKCFKAGDERVNEQVGLTAMHTIWVREHNRIEQRLFELNPHWGGERLYQETRKVVGAMIQHIIYNEQLPMIVGQHAWIRYRLKLQKDGYYYDYDNKVDPRVANSFAAAAYRFGHTLIQEHMRRASYDYEKDDSMMLSSAFRRPVHIYDTSLGGVDSLIRGLCDDSSQRYDTFFTKQISRSLFTEDPPHGPGMDLLSLNIQRGRDHGLPAYNVYRQFCGLRRAYTFDDLSGEIKDPAALDALRRTYRHVDDIDLFAGGVSESSVSGGIVGPTFACIIAQQFADLRKGDRFWYEGDSESGFTIDQLTELRKAKLSRILCANGDYIDMIQPWVLLKPTDQRPYRSAGEYRTHTIHNPRGSCDVLSDIDLTKWQQGPYIS